MMLNSPTFNHVLLIFYEPESPASQPKHLVYQLRVSHKNSQQQVKFENYTVNAWRNLAVWANANLKVGMDVFVRGHLSQRQAGGCAVTEVTALTITPVAGRMQISKTATNDAAGNVASPESPSGDNEASQ